MGENKFRTHDIVSEEKKPVNPVDIHQWRFLKREKKEPKRNKQKATLRVAFNAPKPNPFKWFKVQYLRGNSDKLTLFTENNFLSYR